MREEVRFENCIEYNSYNEYGKLIRKETKYSNGIVEVEQYTDNKEVHNEYCI